jgi:hypothetical protein
VIRNYAFEIVFVFGGFIIFSNHLFEKTQSLKSTPNYFLSAPNHHINSKRDFSVGKISKHSESNKKSDVLVINIYVNKDDFFGFENGIYTLGENWHNNQSKVNTAWWKQNANYKQKGSKWEKKCQVDFDGKIIDSKIKINGNNTRAYPQKSLRFKIDKATQREFWGEETSKWLILRNSGNDWDKTLFADVFMSKAISNLNVYSPKSRLVNAFINDYSWGFYNARERMDEDFFAAKHDVSTKDVFMVENNGSIENGGKEAKQDFEKLKNAIKDNDIEKLKEQIDEDNFIDYVIIETFFNNIDWPSNNVLLFKINDNKSKWQFVPKDLDFGLAYSSEIAFKNNMFQVLENKNTWLSQLFSCLMKDENFSTKFKQRVEFLLENDLSSHQLMLLFTHFEKQYSKIMPQQIQRWRYPRTIDKWKSNVNANKKFISKRGEFYKKHVNQL